jgi:hypothetical protein
MCRTEESTHKHHIIPKYMGGSNSKDNLVEVTVTQHAMFHFCNYQLWSNEEDKIAWRTLSGQITLDEAKEEAKILGRRKGIQTQMENNLGIFGIPLEERTNNCREGGKRGAQTQIQNKIGIHSQTEEEKIKFARMGGKAVNSQKWQCTITGYISTAAGLTSYQKSKGIDTSNRIKVDGPRSWEITFKDGRVIVIIIPLKEWARENGYNYNCLHGVKTGKVKNHRSIIKVIPF